MNAATYYRIATTKEATIKVCGLPSVAGKFTLSYRIEKLDGDLIEACAGICVPGAGSVKDAAQLGNRIALAFVVGQSVRTVR